MMFVPTSGAHGGTTRDVLAAVAGVSGAPSGASYSACHEKESKSQPLEKLKMPLPGLHLLGYPDEPKECSLLGHFAALRSRLGSYRYQ